MIPGFELCCLIVYFFMQLPEIRLLSEEEKGFASRIWSRTAGRASGGHSAAEPPGSIPNPEVKHCSADGSAAKGRARVGRRQFINPPPSEGAGFLLSFFGGSPVGIVSGIDVSAAS